MSESWINNAKTKKKLLCLLLTLSLSYAFSLLQSHAQQAETFTMNGHWEYVSETTGTSIAEFRQVGNSFTAEWVELSESMSDIYGFETRDWAFQGTLEGRSLRGVIHVHYSLEWREKCPGQWDSSAKFNGTIQPDGKTIFGHWEVATINPDCTLNPEGERNVRFVRVDPLPPPLNFTGDYTNLEMFIKILDKRMDQYRLLETQQKNLFAQLDQLADRHIALMNALEDVEPLHDDLQSYQNRRDQQTARLAEHEAAQRAVQEKEQAVQNANNLLREHRNEIYVRRANMPTYTQVDGKLVRQDEFSYRSAEGNDRGATRAVETLQRIERDIQRNNDTASDPGTTEEQRNFIINTTLPKLQGYKTQIETALQNGTLEQAQALERAEGELSTARKALARLQPQVREDLIGQWRDLRRRYRQQAEKASVVGFRLPSLLDNPPSRNVATSIEQLNAMQTHLGSQRDRIYDQIVAALNTLESNDRQALALARRIVELRRDGAVLAEQTLVELGTPDDDPILSRLEELHAVLIEAETYFSSFDESAVNLERLQQYAAVGNEGANTIAAVRDRLDIVNKTLGTLNTYGDSALKVRRLLNQLESPRTALEGLATSLELVGPLGGKVPVLGPVLGQFLGFYAEAAAAAGSLAARIQDHNIQQRLELKRHRPAEDHLYTTKWVRDAINEILNNVESEQIEQIAKRLQVRRLIALLNGAE